MRRRAESAPPMPSSRIDSTKLPLRAASETSMSEAWACFAALAKVSGATKYAAASIGSGNACPS